MSFYGRQRRGFPTGITFTHPVPTKVFDTVEDPLYGALLILQS